MTFKVGENLIKEQRIEDLFIHLFDFCGYLLGFISYFGLIFYKHICRSLYKNLKSKREVKYWL